MTEAHSISGFLDEIKEVLTDAQYKEGMELCQALFHKKEKKLYKMTYMRPFTFLEEHCDDDDCDVQSFKVSFVKATALVQLTEKHAEQILEENLFMDDVSEIIDCDVLRSFPDEMNTPLEWDEVVVLSLVIYED